MKLQFSLATTLRAVSVAGITCATWAAWSRQIPNYPHVTTADRTAIESLPFYFPLIFVAFAVGRRALTVRMAAVFFVSQVAICGVVLLFPTHRKILHHLW